MPAPNTIDEFLDLTRKSGVVDEKRLASHLDKMKSSGQMPTAPVALATQLVRDGILTHFQAEQFLQGKWRRFTLGKYKVLERLGQGGMGMVYLCEHIMMRRRVALKVLPSNKVEDSSSLERFYREARAVAALDHPNIVRAYDIDQEENLHFLVMEHVDGSNLQEIIKRTGPMDVLRAAHYIRQAALGLQHAHETAGLVHRDIKPGNILVDRNGIVKVLDMGLARFFNDEEDILTKKYDENVLGTADYLAPEQALDSHSVDIRADIYSLGGTFYYCLTGKTPFAEGTIAQKLIWHQTRQPKPIRSLRPEIPDGIVAIVDRMMAKDANQRFSTPQEVADALAPWTQTPIPPPPECEMPQFSLAATGLRTASGDAMASSQKGSDSPTVDSPPPRKNWQVSSSATNAKVPAKVSTPAPTVTPPAPRPAPTPTARVASTPVPPPPKPAPSPANLGNGANRAPARSEVPRPAPAPAAPQRLPAQPAETDEDDEELPAFESGGATAARRRGGTAWKVGEKPPLLPIILGAIGLLFFLVLGFGLLLLSMWANWSGRNKDKGPVTRPPIMVTPRGLKAALRTAKPGDRIILDFDDNLLEHSVHVSVSNITIEAPAGKTVVWKCPGDAKKADKVKLLHISDATDVVIKNITFDGANLADAIILFHSRCPGTKLENLRFQNYVSDGILIANCVGEPDRKITCQGLKFENGPGRNAIRFSIFKNMPALRTNRYFTFRDCEFNGAGGKIVADQPDNVDLKTIELPGGVEIKPPEKPKAPEKKKNPDKKK